MKKSNTVFKRLREELSRGVDIDWAYVFGGKKKDDS